MRQAIILSALATLSLLFPGCERQPTTPTDLSHLGQYVSGYVPELINSTDPVRIQFTRDAVSNETIGNPVDDKVYSFSPEVPGGAIWETPFTFLFNPETRFEPGETYTLTLALDEILDNVDSIARTANFVFQVRETELGVILSNTELSEEDPGFVHTRGTLRSSDPITTEQASRIVQFSPVDKNVNVHWVHSKDLTSHSFILEAIPRKGIDSEITVSWDGKVVGSRSTGSVKIRVPGLDNFKISDIQITNGESREIRLVFSDFLDHRADLNGLILINGRDENIRISQQKNIITVFPEGDISGSFVLTVDQSITSRNQVRLKEPARFDLSFEDIAPQVELVGSGNIIPNSGEVNFPFKAVNLAAVDIEIFQIFENNVLQYLQYNDSWYANGFEAVGRVVGQHTIDLTEGQWEPKRNQWIRYAVDLSQYTELSPGSIYEVRLGFKKDYSLYSCPTEDSRPGLPESLTIWRYYYDYDYGSYNFRSDPCKHEYYTSENFVRRNVLASNVGLSAKAGKSGAMHVFAHDLRSTEAIPSCQISAYDFQKQLVSSGATDSEGRCILQTESEIAFIIAKHRSEYGYLKVTDGTALSVSDFDVEGTTAVNGLRGFIYSERDVWRPGDTLFLNFILQTPELKSEEHPVTCIIYNARGQKYAEMLASTHTGPIYQFPFPTAKADPTGNWWAEIRVGGSTFHKTLKVETIKPNRLKIHIDTEGPVLAWQERSLLNLHSNWLHGAPASNLKAKVELTLSEDISGFKGYDGYTFNDPTRKFSAASSVIFDRELDNSGNAEIKLPVNEGTPYPGKLTAHFKTRVFEKGGDFSIDRFSTSWLPYNYYTGLKIQKNRWGWNRLKESEENSMDIAVVDDAGMPVKQHKVTVGVYSAEWNWWYNEDHYELAQYNSGQHLGAFIRDTVITNEEGRAEFLFTPPGYGLYLIRVCDTESGHCSGDFAYAGYYYGGEDDRAKAAKLHLITDKNKYLTGETVEISVPSSAGSLVLISLENEDEVLEVEEITGRGEVTKYRFTATEKMTPNIYAHVSLIQPHNPESNDLPLRMYGVIPISVENPETRLQPVLKMPDALKPEQTFSLEVSEKQGKSMAYTISIVDEGLLDLTRFQTPSPWDHFYAKRALGVTSWDVYDKVLGAYGGRIERILSIGGDASNVQIEGVNEVNRFKPVVIHLGPFYLDSGARAKHNVELPNYVGSVRTMVVAADKDMYGATDKTCAVKNPVMVLTTAPRTLSPGEEILIPVNVFAMEKNIRKVDVTVRGNELLSIRGLATQTVVFDEPGDRVITFQAEVAQKVGKAEIHVVATSGNETTRQDLDIPVRNPNPAISKVDEFVLEPGEKWNGTIEPVGVPGTDESRIEISHFFPLDLGKRLDYLIRYPYGCLEQTTSAAFPQLYVEAIKELTPVQKNLITHNVNGAIRKIQSFIRPAGGFSYWPGSGGINEWTNTYVGHFLLEAKNAGYAVNQSLIDHWKKYEIEKAKMFRPGGADDYDHLQQAYRLYALALAGEPDMGAMNRLRSFPALTSSASHVLAGAYTLTGQTQVAEALFDTPIEINEYKQAGITFGSSIRDMALLVETFHAAGKYDDAYPLVKRIAAELSSGHWYSTQSTAFALLAVARFSDKKADEKIRFTLGIDNNQQIDRVSDKPVVEQMLTPGKSVQVLLVNTSESRLYLRIIRHGRPIDPPSRKIENHLKMEVKYLTTDGKPFNPVSIKQGTDFRMTVRILNPGTFSGHLRDVALETLFPSGWEIVNSRIDVSAVSGDSKPEYQDFRDDRVYTFFDLGSGTASTFNFNLSATYAGRFINPAVYCEAMYDGAVNSIIPGGWIEVEPVKLSAGNQASVTGGQQ